MSLENFISMSFDSDVVCTNHIEDEPLPKIRKRVVTNKVTVVLGAQWGDEGKGKIVDLLATTADIVCRVQVLSFLFKTFFKLITLNC